MQVRSICVNLLKKLPKRDRVNQILISKKIVCRQCFVIHNLKYYLLAIASHKLYLYFFFFVMLTFFKCCTMFNQEIIYEKQCYKRLNKMGPKTGKRRAKFLVLQFFWSQKLMISKKKSLFSIYGQNLHFCPKNIVISKKLVKIKKYITFYQIHDYRQWDRPPS